MLATDQLEKLWTELNVRYFHRTLPPIGIVWSRRLTSSAGLFVSRVGPRRSAPRGADIQSSPRCIKLSAVLLTWQHQQPNPDILTTLAHEMIHQWQYDVLKRRPNHGPDFHRMMERMNQDGLGITIYHSIEKKVSALARYVWRCRQCGIIYRRQRRTIKPRRHQCGACRGPLQELNPSTITRRSPFATNYQRYDSNATSAPVQLTLDFSVSKFSR